MAFYGYSRVSTEEQDLSIQIARLKQARVYQDFPREAQWQ